MKSDARIWRIAADMIAQYGSVAEDKAVGLANLKLMSGITMGRWNDCGLGRLSRRTAPFTRL